MEAVKRLLDAAFQMDSAATSWKLIVPEGRKLEWVVMGNTGRQYPKIIIVVISI